MEWGFNIMWTREQDFLVCYRALMRPETRWWTLQRHQSFGPVLLAASKYSWTLMFLLKNDLLGNIAGTTRARVALNHALLWDRSGAAEWCCKHLEKGRRCLLQWVSSGCPTISTTHSQGAGLLSESDSGLYNCGLLQTRSSPREMELTSCHFFEMCFTEDWLPCLCFQC